MTPEQWSEMMADKRWRVVADGQASAWKTLQKYSTAHLDKRVEELDQWTHARLLADLIKREYERKFAEVENVQ